MERVQWMQNFPRSEGVKCLRSANSARLEESKSDVRVVLCKQQFGNESREVGRGEGFQPGDQPLHPGNPTGNIDIGWRFYSHWWNLDFVFLLEYSQLVPRPPLLLLSLTMTSQVPAYPFLSMWCLFGDQSLETRNALCILVSKEFGRIQNTCEIHHPASVILKTFLER